MKISRIFKTIFLLDFLAGLKIALREVFKSKKKQLTIHLKKEKLAHVLEVNMPCVDIQTVKKDALLVNCVKPSVQLKLSQLNLLREKMVVEKLLDMILIC